MQKGENLVQEQICTSVRFALESIIWQWLLEEEKQYFIPLQKSSKIELNVLLNTAWEDVVQKASF